MVEGREGGRETDLLETRAGSVGSGRAGGFLVVHEMSAALLWRHEDLRRGEKGCLERVGSVCHLAFRHTRLSYLSLSMLSEDVAPPVEFATLGRKAIAVPVIFIPINVDRDECLFTCHEPDRPAEIAASSMPSLTISLRMSLLQS